MPALFKPSRSRKKSTRHKEQLHRKFQPFESIMETCSVVLTFESVDQILWCDHSNETSLAVLLQGTTCFSIFYKMKFKIFLEF